MGVMYENVIKMARRVIKKHSITVPFDLDSIVMQYARISYKPIPISGVDGTCVHLKTPGKKTKVIVSTLFSRARQKFTLAHELGHIIIPWHCGTIVDKVDEGEDPNTSHYWQLEREANRFASELLMPIDCVFSIYKKNPHRSYVQEQLCIQCGVSEEAARIRLDNIIDEMDDRLVPDELILNYWNEFNEPAQVQNELIKDSLLSPNRIAQMVIKKISGNIVYCCEQDGIVLGWGCSGKSRAFAQVRGAEFDDAPYPYFKYHTICKAQDVNTHWWSLDVTQEISDDNRSWREILDTIVNDIVPYEYRHKQKMSFNGKVAAAHGSWRIRGAAGGMQGLIDDAIQRFNGPLYKHFTSHPDFLVFLRKRCEDLANNSRQKEMR